MRFALKELALGLLIGLLIVGFAFGVGTCIKVVSAEPESRQYTFYGQKIIRREPLDERGSCGAAHRFMRERWDVRVHTTYAKVNNVKWDIYRDDPGYTVLTKRSSVDAYMYMFMEIIPPNKAVVRMLGIDEARKNCIDVVELRSRRVF